MTSDILLFLKLNILNFFSKQTLGRTLEPDLVTTDSAAVEDYNQVQQSSLILIYALSLQLLQNLTSSKNQLKILDLACGPGFFTRWMASHLPAKSILGLDLSNPMLEVAKHRFEADKMLIESDFRQQDISDLSSLEDNSVDLVTFMNAAHHLPALETVQKTIAEAARVCRKDGIVFIADHTRPKTSRILSNYYQAISEKNHSERMKAHNLDFYNSLHAGWSAEDFLKLVPKNSAFDWYHIYPSGFQFIRFLIGVPKGSPQTFLDHLLDHLTVQSSLSLIPQNFASSWKLLLLSFKHGARIEKSVSN